MRFLIKRYLYGVSERRAWLFCILLPPLIYLVLAASRADRFTVTQDVAISKDAPVASASNPVDFSMMSQIVSRPADLFHDSVALREIYEALCGAKALDRTDERYQVLVQAADQNLELTMPDNGTARIAYHGRDEVLGHMLVNYYARRLVKRAQAGLVRQSPRAAGKDLSGPLPPVMDETGAIGFKGNREVREHRALWRPERVSPLMKAAVISLVAVLIFLGVLEWSDPAFKSERQIARYLGLPILGSLPDLSLISEALSGKGAR